MCTVGGRGGRGLVWGRVAWDGGGSELTAVGTSDQGSRRLGKKCDTRFMVEEVKA